MKKLIYVILIAVALIFAGRYVKQKRMEAEVKQAATVVEEENFNYDIVDPVTGEVIGTSEGNIVTTTTYDDNADGMIGEEDIEADDLIEEENPELTQDEAETIIAE